MTPDAGDIPIRGTVAPEFEAVGDVFVENFAERGERGGACAVYHRGEKVVDLWGGYRDRERTEPWEEDTMVLVFSTTKGMAAMAVAHARSAGLFDYDDRVARYWPAFGAHGKSGVTIRELLAHQAGLPAPAHELSAADVAATEELADSLAELEPEWTPGHRHGYHAFTLGWYESELIRRTDPMGRTLGEYFEAEIADPNEIEFHIGVPTGIPDERIAEIDSFGPLKLLFEARELPWQFYRALLNPRSLTRRSLDCFDTDSPAELASPEYRRVEIPGGNGIGCVRDIAKAYGKLATSGSGLGIDHSTREELTAPATEPPGGSRDEILKLDAAYSLGYSKPLPGFQFGSGPTAFGAPGAGGSFAFADPEMEIGFAYAPNRMGFRLRDDPRERALREAVYDCLP
ncbi:serine hydrolase domain-containing protein [Halobacteriaceae archaeon SHR40]|uniref:serine hydrolase domain-containing protein n=1 Tax=Halovenus amylolytica TaxID=2500550 RepID=UPI000FE32178